MVDGITFDADTHTYFYGMEQIPSVSEILRPLTDPYLQGIPEHILNWKRDLGTAVHKACELYDAGNLDESTLDERILPYLEGYRKFLADHQPQWDAIEEIVFEPMARYCGTLDRAGTIGDKPVIIDIKTSTKVQATAALQLWAYALAYDEMVTPELFALQLWEGNYKLHHFEDFDLYSETWDALLTLRRWEKKK